MSFNNNNIFGGMTLKALLENPDLQHAPAALSGAPNGKGGKKLGGETIDFTSAFLGPNLWENNKYDGGSGNFNLEYMDLDEFLSENGIPAVETPGLDDLVGSTSPRAPVSPALAATNPILSQAPALAQSPALRVAPQITPQMMVVPSVPVDMSLGVGNFLLKPKVEVEGDSNSQDARAKSPSSNGSITPPISPLPVQVEFSLSESDIALSSIPGESMFDPTAHNFTEDELKPQPMIKKSRKNSSTWDQFWRIMTEDYFTQSAQQENFYNTTTKPSCVSCDTVRNTKPSCVSCDTVFVPEDLKDDRYWARRKKNNTAAKRSRDARRIKENQIAMRASYLEKENSTLRGEMDKVRRENARLKVRLAKFESGSPAAS